MPQPECPWITAQRIADAAKRRCERRRYLRRTAPVRRYNAAVERARHVLKDADPRPGAMTAEQEKAQCAVVNAFLDLR